MDEFWQRYRVALVPVVVAAALGWLSPAQQRVLGAGDAVRDALRSIVSHDANVADTIGEHTLQRDYWGRRPHLLKRSIDYLADHPRQRLVTFDGDRPVVVTPEAIANKGRAYEGRPIVLVGRVAYSTRLSADSSGNRAEVALDSADGHHRVFVGLGELGVSVADPAPGDVVAYIGVVTAVGVLTISSGLEAATASFTVVSDESALGLVPKAEVERLLLRRP